MFQVAFLSSFVASHASNPAQLGDAYGFPVRAKPSDVPIEQFMVQTIKAIYAVSSWPQFFQRVDFDRGMSWGKDGLSRVLRECVGKSEAAGYHTPRRSLVALRRDRLSKEKAWFTETRSSSRR